LFACVENEGAGLMDEVPDCVCIKLPNGETLPVIGCPACGQAFEAAKELIKEALHGARGIMNAHNKSEVARLLAQINGEYEAARQGLSGLAQGIGQHRFITKRMERIGELHMELRDIVGDEAMAMITRELEEATP
jgi:hypothetical protein